MIEKGIITLSGTDYPIAQSFRSLMLFEKMTGKNAYAANTSLTDGLTMMYCMLKSSAGESFKYDFEQFLAALDESPEALTQFNDFMLRVAKGGAETATDKKKAAETR